jgi:hypothetical protein
MAKLIQAIQKFGPKLRLNNMVSQNDLAEWIAMRTGQTPGEVALMLLELAAAVLYFNRRGTPVKLTGLGVFAPSISRDGKYRIKVRTAPRWSKASTPTLLSTGGCSTATPSGWTMTVSRSGGMRAIPTTRWNSNHRLISRMATE